MWLSTKELTVMSFDILYVENSKQDYNDLLKHINKYNEENTDRLPLSIENAENPDDLKSKLNIRYRIILADIYYDNPETGESDSINCLNKIKHIVQKWSDKNNEGRAIPIIAFSRRRTQKQTLADKEGLFDIWDKNTSSYEYVVWRLSKLAQEMSRVQPDSHLQYLIRNMTTGPFIHEQVKMMAQKYNAGWTEYDQIDKAGVSLVEIAQKFNTGTQCEEMWKIMTTWEALGRAVLPNDRGHSRHVINVFWIGYYILNHDKTKKMFIEFWKDLLFERDSMKEVKNVAPIDAINNVWFYAGLFHDVCICIEKNSKLIEYYNTLYAKFDKLENKAFNISKLSLNGCGSSVNDVIQRVAKSLSIHIEAIVDSSIKKNTPDHGFVAAAYLTEKIIQNDQKYFAREAARAILLHNIMGDADFKINEVLSWAKEPIACLLALCDQLQSWDRERGDEVASKDLDFPTRSELIDLQISQPDNSIPLVNISINYITRRHVEKNTVIKSRVEDNLKKILQANPYKALDKIKRPWPFKLESKFYLNRNYLTELIF